MPTVSAISLAYSAKTASASASWLAEAQVQIQQSARADGLLGTLQASKNPGSLKSFLRNSQSNFEALLSAIQSNTETRASLTIKTAAAAYQKQLMERIALEQKLAESDFTPPQPLEPLIYLAGGTTLDTVNNILTLIDGTQIDTTTGSPVIDPNAIIQLPNGAYLDTKNNILTLPGGTRIDIITGLVVSA